MLTPPGVESCLSSTGKSCSDGTTHPVYCAYHGFIQVAGGVIVFANNPYVAGLSCDPAKNLPNDNPSDATIAGGLAHEHSESVTDPELNAWYDSKEQEVADKCRTFKERPNSANRSAGLPTARTTTRSSTATSTGTSRSGATKPRDASSASSSRPRDEARAEERAGRGRHAVTVTGSRFAAGATVSFGEAAATEVVVELLDLADGALAGRRRRNRRRDGHDRRGTSAVTSKDHFKYKTTK